MCSPNRALPSFGQDCKWAWSVAGCLLRLNLKYAIEKTGRFCISELLSVTSRKVMRSSGVRDIGWVPWVCVEVLWLSWGEGREWQSPKFHCGFLSSQLLRPYLGIYKPGTTVWTSLQWKTRVYNFQTSRGKNKLQRGKITKTMENNRHVCFLPPSLPPPFFPRLSLTHADMTNPIITVIKIHANKSCQLENLRFNF